MRFIRFFNNLIEKDSKVALFIGILNFIGMILVAAIGLLSADKINKYVATIENTNIQNSKEILSQYETIIESNNKVENNINSKNIITNNNIFEDANVDPESLLNSAKLYYDAQDYENVIKIYSTSKLNDNITALNNLGYMYANGIYLEKNVTIAESYYNKAIQLGSVQAYNNKLAMYLNNYLPGIYKVILEGYNFSPLSAKFIASFYNEEQVLDDIEIMKDFCYTKSLEEQQEIIESFYAWEEIDIVSSNRSLASTDLIHYELLGDHDILNENTGTAGFIFVYKVKMRKCRNIEILDEKLII